MSPLIRPRRVQQHDPFRDPNPRRNNQDFIDQEERAFKSIRLEAPTFDGTLDTKVYLDWEREMDQYFEWYEMIEGRKFKFAKLRLIRQARMYWDNVERLVIQRGQDPIATWGDLKAKLREKYLPVSYHQRLLGQWHRLIQGNKSVTEYIAKFDELAMRCGINESESVILSRFRSGLHDDVKRELYMREVRDLEQAYQVARDFEQFHRTPKSQYPRPAPTYPSRPLPTRPNPSRPEPSQPSSSRPSVSRLPIDKGKSIEAPKKFDTYFKCHLLGHYASDCPTRSLHLGDLEEEGNPEDALEQEEKVYGEGLNLAEEYEGDEESCDPTDLLGVVRCILTQSKEQEDWRRTNILHTFIKIGEKVCKIIIDSGTCVNAIFASSIKTLGLTPVPHPSPYKVSWIDSTSIPIKLRCQVLIQL